MCLLNAYSGIRVFPEQEQKEGIMPDDFRNPGQIKGLNLSAGSGNEFKNHFKRQNKKDLYLTVLCLPICFFC